MTVISPLFCGVLYISGISAVQIVSPVLGHTIFYEPTPDLRSRRGDVCDFSLSVWCADVQGAILTFPPRRW